MLRFWNMWLGLGLGVEKGGGWMNGKAEVFWCLYD